MADSSHDSTAISVDHDEAGAHRSSGQWPTIEEILGPHDEQPATTFHRKWDIVFTISCVFAAFLDPVHLYILVVDGDRMCFYVDLYLGLSFLALRCALDLFYVMDVVIFCVRRIRSLGNQHKPNAKTSFKARTILVLRPTLRQFVSARGLRAYPILLVPVAALLFRVPVLVLVPCPFLLLVQYTLRVYHTYRLLKRCPNIETKIGRWLNSILDFLPFMFAAHLYGALWYFLSLQRQLDCWLHASPTDDDFYCDEDYSNLRHNITHIKASCPINPPDATIFDFGIFLYALQSNMIGSTSIPRNMLQSFWWGLRNLSSFGSNLQTSL